MHYRAERIPNAEVEFIRRRVIPNSQVARGGRFSHNGRFEIETVPDREIVTPMWSEFLLDYTANEHTLLFTRAGGIWLKPIAPIDPSEQLVGRIPVGSLRRVNTDLSGPRQVGKNGLLVPVESCQILVNGIDLGADEIEDIVVDYDRSLGISPIQILERFPLVKVHPEFQGSRVELIALNQFTSQDPVTDVIVLERGNRRISRRPYRLN